MDSVYFTTKHPIRKTQDHVLAAILLRAMQEGKDIKLPGVMSKKLYWNTDILQDKYIEMFPHLKKINIEANVRSEACFFTGGVDSFYTLLRHKNKISKCIFVKGFDIPVTVHEHAKMVGDRLESIVRHYNKEYIEVETNFRDVMPEVQWLTQFGAALAAVALSLDCVNKVYIPSSGIGPWGSSPEVDPMWSTESTEIVHDGSGVSRLDKIRYIVGHPKVLDYLRVCWQGRMYNCGRCEKCLRTLVQLYICGHLRFAVSFGSPTEDEVADGILGLPELTGHELKFAKENYEACPEGSVKTALLKKINQP